MKYLFLSIFGLFFLACSPQNKVQYRVINNEKFPILKTEGIAIFLDVHNFLFIPRKKTYPFKYFLNIDETKDSVFFFGTGVTVDKMMAIRDVAKPVCLKYDKDGSVLTAVNVYIEYYYHPIVNALDKKHERGKLSFALYYNDDKYITLYAKYHHSPFIANYKILK